MPDPIRPVRGSRGLAATLVAVAVAATISAQTTASLAAARPAPVLLALSPSSSTTFDSPSVFETTSGTTLVGWRATSAAGARIMLARSAGTRFARTAVRQEVAGHAMQISQPPRFYQHARIIRMVTQAEVPAHGTDAQGMYVWTSTDDGRTWSAPRLVHRSFGSNQVADDGAGGFWAVSELTGVQVVHVPANLAPRTRSRVLSTRISSRAWMTLATTGRRRSLLVAFFAASASYLHVGSALGRRHDVRLFGPGTAEADLAGDTRRAMAVGVHPRATGPGNGVFARSIVVRSGRAVLGPEQRLSSPSEDVSAVDVSVQAVTGHPGAFAATWADSTGLVRVAHTVRGGWSRASTAYAFGSTRPYDFPSQQTTTAHRTAVAAFRRTAQGLRSAIVVLAV